MAGTGLSQPPVALLNTMNAATQQYLAPFLGDVVFKPSAAWWGFTREGIFLRGGGALTYPILSTLESSGGPYWGAQLLDTNIEDNVVPATQVWRPYAKPIVIPYTDLMMNRGYGSLDLLQIKYESATLTFLQQISQAMWGISPRNTTLDVDNLVNWVGTQNNTIAGINRSSNAFWNPVAPLSQSGGGALLPATANQVFFSISKGYETPNLLLMSPTSFAAFMNNFTSLNRFDQNLQDKEAVQAGFRLNFYWNTATVLPEAVMPTTQAYFFNTKYIFPTFLESDYFVTEPWTKPTNQRILVSYFYLTWQIMCLSPVYAGANIYNIT